MDLVFLSSRLPLTKTFAQTNGRLAATPYPHVSQVTSHHEQVTGIAEFYETLRRHAHQGHCLFGGRLVRPLKKESRAGLTAREPKQWVVFDFDKVDATDHVDVVRRFLPPECQQVSYIAQLSASMFRLDNTSWSGHIFMCLDKPVDEQRLKQWFEFLNFSIPALTEQLKLSDSEQALHWPLDRTVAYNSKLIFIAPPKCFGFKPAIEESIVLVKKRKPTLAIPEFTPIDSMTIREKINELRRAIGLDEITYDMTPFEGEWVLNDTDEVTVHDIKSSGGHYIRFNLNGGDSYAYFIDLRRPDLIRNFKGEPFLKTEEAAPELWKSLRKIAPRAANKPALNDGAEVLAFYATNQSSAVKIGLYDPVEQKLTLNNSTERAARAWLAEYGVVKAGDLPHMDLVFDPTCDIQYVTGSTEVNTFRATKYMTRERISQSASSISDVPPMANKIIRSMLGDPTDDIYEHFINWLAYIFQFRKKTTTAWVMSGVEGTGKGSFVKYYLRPIFGNDAVKSVQFGLLNQEYNDFLEQALFVVFEEADIDSVENQASLQAKLKHYIADDPITIRRMRTDPYEAHSYCNLMFFSNKGKPVMVPTSDRRYNIAERQTQRMFLSPNEIKMLDVGAELDRFADVLQRWPVNELQVTQLIETQARQDMHEATTTVNQLIADAISRGDLDFFVDRMPTSTEAAADFFNRFNPIGMYRELVDKYAGAAERGETLLVKDEELFVLFRTLIPDNRFFQDSKTWRKRHYKSLGLDVDRQHRVPGRPKERDRGLLVEWKPLTKKLTSSPTQDPSGESVVTPIRKTKRSTK